MLLSLMIPASSSVPRAKEALGKHLMMVATVFSRVTPLSSLLPRDSAQQWRAVAAQGRQQVSPGSFKVHEVWQRPDPWWVRSCPPDGAPEHGLPAGAFLVYYRTPCILPLALTLSAPGVTICSFLHSLHLTSICYGPRIPQARCWETAANRKDTVCAHKGVWNLVPMRDSS